jgi:anti-anti-sigma regulatory factor
MNLRRANSVDPAYLVDWLFPSGRPATLTNTSGNTIVSVSRHVESEALTVVTVDGDIDTDTEALVRAALTRELRTGDVCCDLNGIPSLGAAGAHLLFAAHYQAAEWGHTFSYRGAHGFTARVLATVDPTGIIARQR